MNRVLDFWELSAFCVRHPIETMSVPSTGKLISDSVQGCVLLFPKTDGTVLAIQTDQYPACQFDDPSAASYILQSVSADLAGRLPSIPKWIAMVAIAIAVVVVIQFLRSLQK